MQKKVDLIKHITHIGEGKFEVELNNGEIKKAGPSLCGIIRYTYFEDYSLPEIGWNISHEELIKDYIPKVQQDILSGKIKPNELNR